jgi:hypothetical protein
MEKPQRKPQPSWRDIKEKLAGFDRAGLLGLIQELYAAHKENRIFLHARFGPGDDVLAPYKKIIERWIAPDVFRNQNTSIAKAKQAISDYRKAVGQPEELVELMVFYCELASEFAMEYGEAEGYFDSLAHMFEQALKLADKLPGDRRKAFLQRLKSVRDIGDFGYGVRDYMNDLLSDYP